MTGVDRHGAMARLRRRLASSDERGSTLFEVTLTILILSVVMTVVYAGIISMTNTAAGVSVRLQNLDEGRVMMSTITKDIRTATSPQSGSAAFVSATATDLVFYGNLNNTGAAASQIHITIDATSQLVETVTPATDAAGNPCPTWPCTYDPARAQTRFVGRFLVNSVSQPLFTYIDVGGATLTAPLDSTSVNQVRSVQVSLSVSKTRSYNAAVMTIENTVGLPNIAFQQGT